jgi:L-amino acid N-acyltransferase YncA
MTAETYRTTRAGIKIFIRPVRSEDEELVRSFAKNLSEEDIYFRFFRHVEPSEDFLKRFVNIDPNEEIAVLALVRRGKTVEIVGGGRFFIDHERKTAEVVMTVGHEYQKKGIGREILLHLISLARAQGFKGLTAQVLPDNVAMLRLLRSLEGVEYDIQRRLDAGTFYMDMVFR